MSLEKTARKRIDELLQKVGFIVQDMSEFSTNSSTNAKNFAVREFVMSDDTKADYVLFVDNKACGIIEAKKFGTTLNSAHLQAKHYAKNFPRQIPAFSHPLPFTFESNANEIYFTNLREPKPRQRRIFAFFTPRALLEMLAEKASLRERLQNFPPLTNENLRTCQAEAINALEDFFKLGKDRALIQMATGAGKTFTACNFTFRLLNFIKAKRILFLVDRQNLGIQAKKEFDNFMVQNRKFSELFIIQNLQSNHLDKDAKLIITTIQRLYSILQGENELDINTEISGFKPNSKELKELKYNPNLPIDFFDFIIVDECHRSIYGEWRQVLEYFDAFIIGLTATPSAHTLGFFHGNLVSEYTLERSIIDGVNVGFEIFRINTKITEKGDKLPGGFTFGVRDKRTRKLIYRTLDEDKDYKKDDLDKTVLNPNQIRTILQAYKESIFTQLFPERSHDQTYIPKTLIFAKDDAHAEEIVHIAQDVFNESDEFCQKITYNAYNARDLINDFRMNVKFRIAVTVDMIATGTDIKSLEVLLFMRDVRSQIYYEQMLGRGVRTINESDLKSITPNATAKTHFYLVDAIGVSESEKRISVPLEQKKGVSLKELLESVAKGDESVISSLVARLAKISLKINDNEKAQIANLCGKTLQELMQNLLNSIDLDFLDGKNQDEIKAIKDEAKKPFLNKNLREFLLDLARKGEIIIDDMNDDELTEAKFSEKDALKNIQNFTHFLNENKDKITALSIIYQQSYKKQHLTRKLIDQLYKKLQFENKLRINSLWNAYALTRKELNIKPSRDEEKLINLVQLVRFAFGFDKDLKDFGGVANSRYELWKGRQIKRGVNFSEEQLNFLDTIKDYILSNAYLSADFDEMQDACGDLGGLYRANQLFSDFTAMLDDLNYALLAG